MHNIYNAGKNFMNIFYVILANFIYALLLFTLLPKTTPVILSILFYLMSGIVLLYNLYEAANNLMSYKDEDEFILQNENSMSINKSKCFKCGNENSSFQNIGKDKIQYNCPNCGTYEY